MKAIIDPAEFERLRRHGHAGYGRPMDPDAPGVWWLYPGPRGTTLAFGRLTPWWKKITLRKAGLAVLIAVVVSLPLHCEQPDDGAAPTTEVYP